MARGRDGESFELAVTHQRADLVRHTGVQGQPVLGGGEEDDWSTEGRESEEDGEMG
jgi:hypothetical protein